MSDVNIEIKSRRMRWVGYVALMGERRNSYMSLVGKPEKKGGDLKI
jgi:hypothetical protein